MVPPHVHFNIRFTTCGSEPRLTVATALCSDTGERVDDRPEVVETVVVRAARRLQEMLGAALDEVVQRALKAPTTSG
jgi:hypothetical protein